MRDNITRIESSRCLRLKKKKNCRYAAAAAAAPTAAHGDCLQFKHVLVYSKLSGAPVGKGLWGFAKEKLLKPQDRNDGIY